ncbi:MAG: lipoprotein-releasing ABC transporter permease subunit, partial [Cellvibrionaceae bacterium]|nr:lipoprotein-releasing ABC transporter permease subunit [Cellvibrionaceae bacterium]
MNATSVFIGVRYIASRRHNRSVSFISAIAMTGIVLGVALLITVLSVMNGFDRELRERILNIMPHITLYQGNSGVSQWRSVRDTVLSHHAVVGAVPFVELQAMVNAGKYTQPALVYGMAAEWEASVSRIEEFLLPTTLDRVNQQENVIALGRGLAEALNVAIGDQLTLLVPQRGQALRTPVIRRVQLIDIFTTGTEVDQKLALMGLEAAKAMNPQLDDVSGLHIKTKDLLQAPVVATQLRAHLAPVYATRDWTQTHGNLYTAIQMSKNLVSLLLFLIIAIAAFNVVSTLVMMVVDKQADIAILRTLGLTRGGVMLVFVTQGLLVGIIGTLLGVLLGVLLSLSVGTVVAAIEALANVNFLQTDIYPVSFLPSSIAINDLLLV